MQATDLARAPRHERVATAVTGERPVPPRRQALQALAAVGVQGGLLSLLGLLGHAGSAAWAQNATPDADLPGARLLGQAKLRFWGLEVYDASLWVGPGFQPASFAQHPFALELVYRRALVGERIAQRSLDEMQALPGFDAARGPAWLTAMKALFPDVASGDRLTGLHRPGAGAAFRLNGRTLGTVDDPAFASLFFGIWLSPATSEPRMRQGLLGQAA